MSGQGAQPLQQQSSLRQPAASGTHAAHTCPLPQVDLGPLHCTSSACTHHAAALQQAYISHAVSTCPCASLPPLRPTSQRTKLGFAGGTTRCLNLGSYNYLGFAAADAYCTPRVLDTLGGWGISTCSSRTEAGEAAAGAGGAVAGWRKESAAGGASHRQQQQQEEELGGMGGSEQHV